MIHVDDQLIASNDRQHLDVFKSMLNNEFECKDNGPISSFLGTRDRTARRLYISQERYLEDVLYRFDMSHCSPVKSTSPADIKPKAATDGKRSCKAPSLPSNCRIPSICGGHYTSRHRPRCFGLIAILGEMERIALLRSKAFALVRQRDI